MFKLIFVALIVGGSVSAADPAKVSYAATNEIEASSRSVPETRPGISLIDYADTPKYSATVIRRTAPDKSEVHQAVTDIWYVMSGSGTLVTGGSLTEPVQTEPDELRGKVFQEESSAASETAISSPFPQTFRIG